MCFGEHTGMIYVRYCCRLNVFSSTYIHTHMVKPSVTTFGNRAREEVLKVKNVNNVELKSEKVCQE